MIIDSSNHESGLGGKFQDSRPAHFDPETAEIVHIVRSAQQGDAGAQTELVQRYQSRVTGLARTILRHHSVVEDVVQTVMIRMVRRLPHLRQPEVFESWLLRMTRNESLDFLRRAKRRPSATAVEWDWPSVADSTDDHSHRQIQEAVEHAIRILTDFERRIIQLVIAGHSYQAIATRTGLTPSAVKIRIYRIRVVLRPLMLEALGETAPRPPPQSGGSQNTLCCRATN